ncbi:hypothetical protein DL764_002639 [Monosporascus ibericus]|uniref:Uncharacterized protein n=1 Tax=Monosporascus ibericus TaxID=155417 RepID=A0A4Q4TP88_9PEZI|nr:hypothetical protein DL764_002639 [Monosporascus ibericus]
MASEPARITATAAEDPGERLALVSHFYPQPPYKVVGTLPPLIPVPDPESLQWDSGLSLHGLAGFGINGIAERRHSGWAAVEQQWDIGGVGSCSSSSANATICQGSAATAAGETTESSSRHQRQQWEAFQEEEEMEGERERKKRKIKTGPPSQYAREAASKFPYPQMSIPAPRLESDFRIQATLSAQTATLAAGGGDGLKKKRWTTFLGGAWSGCFGYGTVVGGGQETRDLVHGNTSGLQLETTQRLETADDPPAYIECKARGTVTGPAEVVRALGDRDAEQADHHPLRYSCRVLVTMRTADKRYAERLNFGMWVGGCVWKGADIVCE